MFRTQGGIPPLVELLEFSDAKVQRAAAGALRTLAFKNDENKNQVDDCHFYQNTCHGQIPHINYMTVDNLIYMAFRQ